MAAHTKGTHVPTTSRVRPPLDLAAPAAAIFLATVQSVDPDHFSRVDIPLLAEYANAAAQAAQASAELAKSGLIVDGKPSPWLTVQEKSVRAMVALSARLRVAPQSRFDRLVAGANSRPQKRQFRDPDGLLAGDDDDEFDALAEFMPEASEAIRNVRTPRRARK